MFEIALKEIFVYTMLVTKDSPSLPEPYPLTRRQSVMYRTLLFVVLGVITLLMVRLALTGRTVATSGYAGQAIKSHQKIARFVLYGMLLFVVLVEARVRMKGGSQPDALFWTHLGFAICFFILLILLNFWFNGHRSSYHPKLAYPTLVMFLGTVVTGVPMILRRF
jgi:hypothetical protein